MIQAKNHDKLKVEIQSRGHKYLSDVATSLGGDDEGMNPHEILEASLAACTLMTMKMYAQRKALPLEEISVEVKVESEGAESVISRKLSFSGPLSEEQRNRLLEIANKCPIHRLLESKVRIETTAP